MRISQADVIGRGHPARWPQCTILLVAGLLVACARVDRVRDRFRAASPREAYEHALAEAGLAETALGRDWRSAGEEALATAPLLTVPFREEGYLPPERPGAVGYRFAARRGQRLTAEAVLLPDTAARVFLDLYQLYEDTARAPRRVASADSGSHALEFEARRTSEYVLRLQPELLRGGRYQLTVRLDPTLSFPVEGRSTRNIRSGFGDPRDGGRRAHHGVDIFARRRTPALAAVTGVVSSVAETPVGGKVVWLRDVARGQRLYYAHLDSQLVRRGQRVRVGDTVGLVGNTGNARTTPPHLHFGIYVRGEGPVDPFPFLYQPDTLPPPLRADTARLGSWVRIARRRTALQTSPDARSPGPAALPVGTVAQVTAALGRWYRVLLPDHTRGFIPGSATATLARPLEEERLARPYPLRDRPDSLGVTIREIPAGRAVEILGAFHDYLYVRLDASPAADRDAGGSTDRPGTNGLNEPLTGWLERGPARQGTNETVGNR